jgi:hypothetical protein
VRSLFLCMRVFYRVFFWSVCIRLALTCMIHRTRVRGVWTICLDWCLCVWFLSGLRLRSSPLLRGTLQFCLCGCHFLHCICGILNRTRLRMRLWRCAPSKLLRYDCIQQHIHLVSNNVLYILY